MFISMVLLVLLVLLVCVPLVLLVCMDRPGAGPAINISIKCLTHKIIRRS